MSNRTEEVHVEKTKTEGTRSAPVEELMRPGGILRRLLQEGFEPQARALMEIALNGNFAVVEVEPSEAARYALRAMGQRSRGAAFGVTRTKMQRVASATSDHTWRAWAAKPSNTECLRIFVVIQSGTLLVNYEPEKGYSIEPNSTDADTLS